MFSSKDKVALETQLIKALGEKMTAEARVEAVLGTIEDKNKEIGRLQAQVDKLQDALVASSSPKAYEDRRNDQQDLTYVPTEESKQQAARAKINGELLWQMEQPIFKNADDMIEALTGSVEFGKTESIHGNSES